MGPYRGKCGLGGITIHPDGSMCPTTELFHTFLWHGSSSWTLKAIPSPLQGTVTQGISSQLRNPIGYSPFWLIEFSECMAWMPICIYEKWWIKPMKQCSHNCLIRFSSDCHYKLHTNLVILWINISSCSVHLQIDNRHEWPQFITYDY